MKQKLDVIIAAIGNPMAWLAGFSWGALASIATFLYFFTRWLFDLWDRYKGKPPTK